MKSPLCGNQLLFAIPDHVGDVGRVSRQQELVAAQRGLHRLAPAFPLFGHRLPARIGRKTPGPFYCARLLPVLSFVGASSSSDQWYLGLTRLVCVAWLLHGWLANVDLATAQS